MKGTIKAGFLDGQGRQYGITFSNDKAIVHGYDVEGNPTQCILTSEAYDKLTNFETGVDVFINGSRIKDE